ncbi:MAG: FkbM family methyltransferase, partial [Alphaproteobacteria bacterium]|nr:FkbM family methyltransferase [Alphaproteobacteria bacterium]
RVELYAGDGSMVSLPEGSPELERSYHRLARSYAALDQPLAAGWATTLAMGRTFRFNSDPSCQLPVLSPLYQAILPAEPGWFVEIGAYDGVTFSNTSGLAGAGWHGLYVEPHRVYFELCRKHHARNAGVRFENCAVGRTAGEGVFRDAGAMSTVSTDRPSADAADEPVSIVRLETLLAKHGVPPGFELLVVDVEGHEEQVFDSFDLAAWRPRALIVEQGDLDLSTPAPSDPRWRVHRRLIEHTYRVVYQDNINTIYAAAGVGP